MKDIHDFAISAFTAELQSFPPSETWSADDCYRMLFAVHDQLEVLVHAIPTDPFYANRYRRNLAETKKVMEHVWETDRRMPKEIILEFHERLRPYKSRIGHKGDSHG
jgi:hypothetical protein